MESLTEMPPDASSVQQPRGKTDVAMPRQSRTRHGRALLLTLDHLDQRTAAAKAARVLVASLTSDMGGNDQLSAGERELVKRAALCGAIVADFEARWVAGQEVALSEYLAVVNVQRRVLATLGLKRMPNDITPDPLTYARQYEAEAAE
jgi:hypothetical protein